MKPLAATAALVVSLLAIAGIAIAAKPLTKVTESVEIAPGQGPGDYGRGSADPRCRGGRFAVAGGFESSNEPGELNRRAAAIAGVPAGQRWRVRGIATGSEGGRLTATAYCAKRKPAVRTRTISIPSGQTRALRVRCPGGKQVVGIGYEGEFDIRFGGPAPGGRATVVYAAQRADARTAVIRAASQSFGDPQKGRLTGHAICSKSPGLRSVSDTTDVAPGEEGTATAKCPSGRVAMFGGFEQVLPNGSAINVQGGVADSVRSGDRAWRVRLVNDGGQEAPDLRIRSYAYCAG